MTDTAQKQRLLASLSECRPETWHHADELLGQLVGDIANKAKIKADT